MTHRAVSVLLCAMIAVSVLPTAHSDSVSLDAEQPHYDLKNLLKRIKSHRQISLGEKGAKATKTTVVHHHEVLHDKHDKHDKVDAKGAQGHNKHHTHVPVEIIATPSTSTTTAVMEKPKIVEATQAIPSVQADVPFGGDSHMIRKRMKELEKELTNLKRHLESSDLDENAKTGKADAHDLEEHFDKHSETPIPEFYGNEAFDAYRGPPTHGVDNEIHPDGVEKDTGDAKHFLLGADISAGSWENSQDAYMNEEPIIGILTQPDLNLLAEHHVFEDYIPSSYVKWIEAAGGRAVAIPFNATKTQIHKAFSSINGLLIPGGKIPNRTPQVADLLHLARKANDAGTYFPVWGTCAGFQMMLQDAARDPIEFQDLDGEDVKKSRINGQKFDTHGFAFKTYMTSDARASRMMHHTLSGYDKLAFLLSNHELAYHSHDHGTSPRRFHSNKHLRNFYKVVGTSFDTKHDEFVTMIEAWRYPFYATAWHPEKNTLEHGMDPDGTAHEIHIPHSPDAVRVSLDFSYFFVNECRKNNQGFDDPTKKEAMLLYGVRHSTKAAPKFVETYCFTWQGVNATTNETTFSPFLF